MQPPADVNYTFSPAEIDLIRPYGDVRRHEKGAVLAHEGDQRIDVMVTLSGQTDVVIATKDGPVRVGWMETGQFTGDVGVLTGQAVLATITMGETGELLHVPFDKLQRLLADAPTISDILIRTFTARRAYQQNRQRSAVVVIGAAYDRGVFAARDLLAKHNVAHSWLDPDQHDLAKRILNAKGLTDADLPVVIRGESKVLVRPTIADLSAALGLDLIPDDASVDLIVVGAGPGGLAAAVYGASEGLSVVAIDAEGPGGQAGTSSKIENYLGFPTGVSGRELANRAAVQAQKFGVRMATPAKAKSLTRLDSETYRLALEDGRRLRCRALVVATGAQYRRLPIDRLADFEGRGVYYGASPMEAQLCGGSPVAVVGAGNSAGQGAMFLSQTASAVHVLYRRPDIRETMSDYLVRRLEDAPNIHLHPQSEIAALHGDDAADPDALRLTHVTMKTADGEERLNTPFVFMFLGAAPMTEWLPETIARDRRGFLITGSDLDHKAFVRARWPLERLPSRYETSWPRVFAVGDVRAGSVKRVASAVGEGSVCISDVHAALNAPDG